MTKGTAVAAKSTQNRTNFAPKNGKAKLEAVQNYQNRQAAPSGL